MSGSTTGRGYGWEHQQMRARLLPEAIGTPCSRCGETMHEWQDLELDHNDDREGYRGFSHQYCNRKAGGEKGARGRGWVWKAKPRRPLQELSVDPADL